MAALDPLPASHRVAAVEGNDDGTFQFVLRDQPLPVLGPSEVLVQLSVSGVCGTDMALASGKLGPCQSILGHEGVGRVVQLGSAVTTAHVKLGQRVGVAWMRDICGTCSMCLKEAGETRCLEQIHSGRKVDGTFAEYTVVPVRYILQLQEGLSDEEVAPILCGGVTVYKALKICGAIPGQWLAISGAGGGVGSLGIQYAKSMGYRVVGIDGGIEKESYCKRLGAEVYIDFTRAKNVPAAVLEATEGQGVSAVLAVAGTARAYQQSFEMMAPFGTLVCIGIPPPSERVSFHPLDFIDMGFTVIGSAVGTRGDVLEALKFVKRGHVTPTIQKVGLDKLNSIAQEFHSGAVLGKYVVNLSPKAIK